MSEEKIFVRGSAKGHKFESGGENIKFSINIKDDVFTKYADDKGWIQLVMSSKRAVDQFGNSHMITVNTWKPDKDKPQTVPQAKSDSNLPF